MAVKWRFVSFGKRFINKNSLFPTAENKGGCFVLACLPTEMKNPFIHGYKQRISVS